MSYAGESAGVTEAKTPRLLDQVGKGVRDNLLNFGQINRLLGIPGQVSYACDAAGRRVQKKPANR